MLTGWGGIGFGVDTQNIWDEVLGLEEYIWDRRRNQISNMSRIKHNLHVQCQIPSISRITKNAGEFVFQFTRFLRTNLIRLAEHMWNLL